MEYAVLSNFLNFSSFNGLLILYIYCLSYKSKTPFVFKEVLELAGLENDYSFAYTVASSSFGLVKYELKKDICTVNGINEFIADHLSDMLDEKITDLGEDKADFLQELKDVKVKVEDYFK